MKDPILDARTIRLAVASLALLLAASETALGQRAAARKSKAKKAVSRAKAADKDAPAADRIVLREGKELLGQVFQQTPQGNLHVLARRDWLRAQFPDRMGAWEDAEKEKAGAAAAERRRRLEAWRQDRPAVPVSGDRITSSLDRELSSPPGAVPPPVLMAVQLGRGDVRSVQRRGEAAAQALRCAWLLGLKEPETTPLATLGDSIAGRGMLVEGDDPVAVDRLLPPSPEDEGRWLLRRAATEVLNDEGLRFVSFANTVLPEPTPGQPPDPSLGAALVHLTIRDLIIGGRENPLEPRLQAVAGRGRVGAMVTRIEVAADLSAASAESTLYYRGPSGRWDRGLWRSSTVRVGEIPPIVVDLVAADPQVRALTDLVDQIGGGLVSPELKQQGLELGATAGGAAVMARSAITRSLVGLAIDLRDDRAGARGAPKP